MCNSSKLAHRIGIETKSNTSFELMFDQEIAQFKIYQDIQYEKIEFQS